MEIENGAFELIKSKLARSLKETLTREASTPQDEKNTTCEVHIPYHQIKPDEDEPDTAQATVTYVVLCPEEKKHTVRIKFRYDKNGKFVKDSMTYA